MTKPTWLWKMAHVTIDDLPTPNGDFFNLVLTAMLKYQKVDLSISQSFLRFIKSSLRAQGNGSFSG